MGDVTVENREAAARALGEGRPALVWRRLIADTETPVGAAAKLIEATLPSEGGTLLLPEAVRLWLKVSAGQRGAVAPPTTIPIEGGRQLQLSFLGKTGDDEFLFRLTGDDDGGQEAALRRQFAVTQREAEVLLWIARGKSNRDIGEILGLSPRTVNKHLEQVYQKFRDKGFAVCGFPANDFGAQEPGTDQEIQKFCQTNYPVDFPMFSKIVVTGADTHPLYRALIDAQPKASGDSRPGFRENLNNFLSSKHNSTTNSEPGILWNFEKFLVDRNGKVVARFSPEIVPDDPMIVSAIEAAL